MQNISEILFVFFITLIVLMNSSSRHYLLNEDVTPSLLTFECQLQSRVSEFQSPFTQLYKHLGIILSSFIEKRPNLLQLLRKSPEESITNIENLKLYP